MGCMGVRTILAMLPDFCVKKAVEELAAGDPGEAGCGERGCGVRKVGDAEVRKDAEGEVEEADVEGGEGFEDGDLWDGEIGDEPESAGGSVCGKLVCEGLEFGLGEAVEEEVGDDEVCFRCGSDGEGGGLVGQQTVGVGPAAAAKQAEHGGAGVYGGGLEIGLVGEETGEEAAVAVAE